MKQDTMGILLTVADGNYDEIGYENVEGHNPVSDNEISVGVNVARTLGIKSGDSLDIYIEGEKHTRQSPEFTRRSRTCPIRGELPLTSSEKVIQTMEVR